MAEAAAHDEEVEDFMGAEVFMPAVEERELEGIDYSTDGIDDASCQKPVEGCPGQGVDELSEGQYAGPAHGYINHRGEPFGTVHPEAGYQDSQPCQAPDQYQKQKAGGIPQGNDADGSIGSCNQHIDHHMIEFFQSAIYLGRNIKGMVDSTCHI